MATIKRKPFKPSLRSDDIATKLIMRYEIINDCFEWTGQMNGDGYGVIKYRDDKNVKHQMTAHRASYITFVEIIDNKLVVDHLCRNRKCINPDHLEPVTRAENILRGYGYAAINKRKTHCLRGHEFTKDNIYSPPVQPQNRKPHSGRECRKCRYDQGVKRRQLIKKLNRGVF